nr:MAG TPA: hypothetical protein [Bacteriophage sp.]
MDTWPFIFIINVIIKSIYIYKFLVMWPGKWPFLFNKII